MTSPFNLVTLKMTLTPFQGHIKVILDLKVFYIPNGATEVLRMSWEGIGYHQFSAKWWPWNWPWPHFQGHTEFKSFVHLKRCFRKAHNVLGAYRKPLFLYNLVTLKLTLTSFQGHTGFKSLLQLKRCSRAVNNVLGSYRKSPVFYNVVTLNMTLTSFPSFWPIYAKVLGRGLFFKELPLTVTYITFLAHVIIHMIHVCSLSLMMLWRTSPCWQWC